MRTRLLVGLAALLAVVAFTSGCSSSAKAKGGAGSSSSSGTTVVVKNFSFTPAALTVAKGTKVTWKFEDSVAHNVTASNNAFKSSNLSSGGTYSFTFNTPGTYNYICTIHSFMKASITVK